MKIYHGTSARQLDAILEKGIVPRKATKHKGNWDKFPSRPDMVYLTTAYPLYFGICALNETEDTCVVFEIDLDKLSEYRLYPDEDFIAQGLKDIENHKKYRKNLERWKGLWQKSIEHLGNACYLGTIPKEAITRYAVFNNKKRPHISMTALDPTISIINYSVMGWQYREIVAWLFGNQKELPMVKYQRQIQKMMKRQGEPNMVDKMNGKQIEFWKKQSRDRTGIEVVNVNNY
jgi:hypothetical protein